MQQLHFFQPQKKTLIKQRPVSYNQPISHQIPSFLSKNRSKLQIKPLFQTFSQFLTSNNNNLYSQSVLESIKNNKNTKNDIVKRQYLTIKNHQDYAIKNKQLQSQTENNNNLVQSQLNSEMNAFPKSARNPKIDHYNLYQHKKNDNMKPNSGRIIKNIIPLKKDILPPFNCNFNKSQSSKFLFQSPKFKKQKQLPKQNLLKRIQLYNINIYQTINTYKKQSFSLIKSNTSTYQQQLSNFNCKTKISNQSSKLNSPINLKEKRKFSQGNKNFTYSSPYQKKSQRNFKKKENFIQKENLSSIIKCCFCQNICDTKSNLKIPCSIEKIINKYKDSQEFLKQKKIDGNNIERGSLLRQAFYCPLTSSDYKKRNQILNQFYNDTQQYDDSQLAKAFQKIKENPNQFQQKMRKQLKNIELRTSFSPSPSPQLSKAGNCSPYTQKSPVLLQKYHKLLPQFEDIIYQQDSDLQDQQTIKNSQNNSSKISIKHHKFLFKLLDKQNLKILNKENCQVGQLTDYLKCFLGQILGKIKFKNQIYSFENFNEQVFDLTEDLQIKQQRKIKNDIILLYKRYKKRQQNQKQYQESVSQLTQGSRVDTQISSLNSRLFASLLQSDKNINIGQSSQSRCTINSISINRNLKNSNSSTDLNIQSNPFLKLIEVQDSAIKEVKFQQDQYQNDDTNSYQSQQSESSVHILGDKEDNNKKKNKINLIQSYQILPNKQQQEEKQIKNWSRNSSPRINKQSKQNITLLQSSASKKSQSNACFQRTNKKQVISRKDKQLIHKIIHKTQENSQKSSIQNTTKNEQQ